MATEIVLPRMEGFFLPSANDLRAIRSVRAERRRAQISGEKIVYRKAPKPNAI